MSRQLRVEVWIGESQEFREQFDNEADTIKFINEHVGNNWNALILEKQPCGHFEAIGNVYDKITGTLDEALRE